METDRELARRVVAEGLIATDGLLAAEEPSVPDRYAVERAIGQGGGGTVYLARDVSLDRPVALKFLTDASPADLERFRREARFTARLNDPSIVQVYEMGDCDGWAYIAMQYVDGANLRAAELSIEGIVRALRSVAHALHRAHAIGIVHRDIKPENILLDVDGNAYLTDFGIARDLSGALGETMSREGQIMGTPALMPPEQARGETQNVDSRSDVYSLGATLYCKLTGRYPFEADNVVEVLHAVIHDDPALPRAHDPSIPRALEAIAMKCLRKRREDRYQRMSEIVTEFDRYLDGSRGEAEGNAWFRRLVGKMASAPPAPDPAESVEDTRWALGVELIRELSAWDANLYRVSGSLQRSFDRLDGIRERFEEVIETTPDAAWARFYRGVVLFRRGDLHGALEDMECAIDRVKNLAGAYFELGRLYLALYLRDQDAARKHVHESGVQSGLEEARARLEQAKLAFQEAKRLQGELQPWHQDYAQAVTLLADADYNGCVAECDQILADEPDLEEVWKLRGDALRFAGGDPFESFQRAVDVRRSYFEAYYCMGEAYLANGSVAEARAALERATEIHPCFADGMALLASSYLPEHGGGTEVADVEAGLRAAERARELDPSSYQANVTLARFQLELAQASGESRWLEDALATLVVTSDLEGCQNRVNMLRCEAALSLAAAKRERGEDPRAELEEVERISGEVATVLVEEGGPWFEIRRRLEEENSRTS